MRVAELWRFPVKSMLGERLEAARVTERGIDGDRAYGVRDVASRQILSARRVPLLFGFRARWNGGSVTITLPGETTVLAGDADVDVQLSAALGRDVRLTIPDPGVRARVADEDGTFRSLEGTFFDAAPIHIVTDATLARLRELLPGSDLDRRRFRANVVLETGAPAGFVEDEWIGRRLSVGGAVLHVTKPCSRCVMTTLAQDDLPKDREVLRGAIEHNEQHVGVYAKVVQEGEVAVGDVVEVS